MPPFSFILLQFNKNLSIYYLVFDLSGLWGENDVSRVKGGRWNKKIWETLNCVDLISLVAVKIANALLTQQVASS